jgi:CRP/FNR family cyclic AMP-dependent transcriptional regulator
LAKCPERRAAMKHEIKAPFDPRAYLAQAGDGRTVFDYGPNEAIFAQGEPADAAFYVQAGQVKISAPSRAGKDKLLQILGRGSFLGLSCLVERSQRLITATAITECRVVRLEKAVLTRMLRQEPGFAEFVMSFLLTRAIRMQEDLVDQLFNSSERRLARALLRLANLGQDGPNENTIPRVSRICWRT